MLSLEPVWCKSKANLKDTGAVLEKVDEATEKITVIINATAEIPPSASTSIAAPWKNAANTPQVATTFSLAISPVIAATAKTHPPAFN